ncbi:MAG: FAD:protein FMN transferase [Planctomycetaceae bacterium]
MRPQPLFLKSVLFCLCFILAVSLVKPANGQETTTQLSGPVFGTTYNISFKSDSVDEAVLAQAIDGRLAEIDLHMSNWRNDSDVSKFNATEPNIWFSVSQETASVVAKAKSITDQSNGMFDITVAPLVRAWNFGAAAKSSFNPPTEEQINDTLQHVGSQYLEVRLAPPALKKTVAALEVDLSAIAKGYAVDAISELLTERSVDHFMVEIGGEIRASGASLPGAGWRIGLEAPERNARKIDSVIALHDEALATSGDYRNFFEFNGVTYSHTIDPTTGMCVDHDLASVSVIANSCMEADAWATAILAMGPDVGFEWAKAQNIKAMLLRRSTTGQPIRELTKGFPSPIIQITSKKDGTMSNEFFQLFLVTAAVFGVAVLAMSIGTIVANRRLQGSCGGMAGLKDEGGSTVCDMCTRPSAECSGNPEADRAAADSSQS